MQNKFEYKELREKIHEILFNFLIGNLNALKIMNLILNF